MIKRKVYQIFEFIDLHRTDEFLKIETKRRKILISFIESIGERRIYRNNFKIISESGDDILEIKIEPNKFMIKFLNSSIHAKIYLNPFEMPNIGFKRKKFYEIDGYTEDDVKLIFELGEFD